MKKARQANHARPPRQHKSSRRATKRLLLLGLLLTLGVAALAGGSLLRPAEAGDAGTARPTPQEDNAASQGLSPAVAQQIEGLVMRLILDARTPQPTR